MKMKHLVTAGILCLLVVLIGVFGLTACSDDEACAHEWGEWSVKAEPTCSAVGAKERTCSLCSKVQTAQLEAIGHDWNEATCTTPKTCKVCSTTEGGPLGHIGGVATCKQQAVCTICATAYGALDPFNHISNGEWTAVNAAKHEQVCADCGTSYEKDHIWSNSKCVACGYSCVHNWVGSICTGCGQACQHSGGTATCTERATCEICNRPYGELKAHDFTLEIATPEYRKSVATCEVAATYYKSCACGTKSEETFTVGNALGHAWGDYAPTTNGFHARTCANDPTHVEESRCHGGYTTCTDKAICDDCHAGYGITPTHAWNAGTQVSAPSCLGAGEMSFTCTICGDTKSEPIEPLGHDMVDEVTDPTCTTKGFTTHTCQRGDCHESYTDSEVDALGHDWDQEPGCENGSTCLRGDCGATQPALGHDYQETDFTEATCENAAYHTYTCSVCGDSYDNPDGDPNGHSITGVTPTRVLKEGETCIYIQYYKCTVCQTDVPGTEVTNHDMTTAITRPATCVTPGEKLRSCTKCDYADPAETIPADATGHAWTLGEVVNGERTDTCSNPDCGATKTVVVYDGSATNAGNLADKEVELNGANINLGSDVANTIGDQDITLAAGKTEGADREQLGLSPEELAQVGNNPIYDFTITGADGNPISQFGENNYVTITLPYQLTEGEDVDNIAVWFINDQGGLTSIKATYNNGYVTFQTNHFSYYTVTRLTPEERCELYGHADSTREVPGDCLHDSYLLTVCARCHRTEKTITVEADGHDYECVTTPATCTTVGKNVYTCSDCGASYETKIPATGHSFVESENVPATCAAPGRLTKVCEHEDCDASTTVSFAQLKHVFTVSVIAPTCEAGGYTVHDCDNCDYSYTDSNVAPIGHSYVATFTWNGTQSAVATLTCANDASHSFTLDATVTSRLIPSTCPAGDRTEYTAKVLYNGATYTDVSAVQSGNGEHRYTIAKFDGEGHWNECICGAKDEVIAHTFGTATVTKNATCAVAGESVASCACGATLVTVIPATENHIYDNGFCIECGAQKGGDCDHTDLQEITLDLSEYGACGGLLTLLSCECGEVCYMIDEPAGFACPEVEDGTEYEEGVDENGNPYMSMHYICPECGLDLSAYMSRKQEGCEVSVSYDYTFTINGTTLNALMSDTWSNHNTKETVIDLSEYSTCGGYITARVCNNCDKITSIVSMRPGCNGEGSSMEEVTIDGITYMIATMDCPDCDLVFVQKMWQISASVCESERWIYMSVSLGDTVLFEYEECIESVSDHEWEYEYTMKGDTCEDGWTATRTCSKCGASQNGSGDSHDNTYSTVDLSALGMCGGQARIATCRICQTTRVEDVNDYACMWINQGSGSNEAGGIIKSTIASIGMGESVPSLPNDSYYPDSNGTSGTSVCLRCGTIKQYTENASEKDEDCKVSYYKSATYTLNGEVIFSYEATHYMTEHDWQYDFEMQGESCEDGVNVHEYCPDCGESDDYTTYSHSTVEQRYELSEYGACGGYVSVYACPCGEESGINWNLNCDYRHSSENYTDDNGLVHTVETRTCTNCGLVMTQDSYSVREGCYIYYYTTTTVKVGDTTVVDGVPSTSWGERHTWDYDFQMNGSSCEDGVSYTAICTACDESYNGYWEYHNTVEQRYELSEYGACEGYISFNACPCGYNSYYNNSLGCKFSSNEEPTTYTDDYGTEHTVYTATCQECGLVQIRDSYRLVEGCNIYDCGYITLKMGDNEIVSNAHFKGGYWSNHDYVYSYSFEGDQNCESGVLVIETCSRCDYYHEEYRNEHYTNRTESIDLSEYGACGSTLDVYECPCGMNKHIDVNRNDGCNLTWTSNEYYDEEGLLHHVGTYACTGCGLRYQTDSHTVRDASTCRAVTYYSSTVVVGLNAVGSYTYQSSEIAHDRETTAELVNGAGSSCEDGVIITYTCKDCGDSYTQHETYHHSFEQERIELDQYGSVCHGYLSVVGCACGRNRDMSLEHAMCDLDRVDAEFWIADEGIYYRDAYVYTCAVTDPERCGLKIRYAYYEKQDPGSCYGYSYETWQFGYNEQDGTWAYEITYKTGGYETRHNWNSESTDGTWTGGTTHVYSRICSNCNSSEVETYYYDTNRNEVKYNRVYINNLNNGNDKRSETTRDYVWYESKVEADRYIKYALRTRYDDVRADGSEYWEEYNYSYDFTDGCKCTRVYTDSDGDYNTYTENAHNTYHVHLQDATCSQDGSAGYKCSMCGEIVSTYVLTPAHSWVYVNDTHYFCAVCGLENANGASGAITMEDLTAQYGNGTHYVIGYYLNNAVEFSYYVALITENGEEHFIQVEITFRDDIRALTFSKADVQAAAEALGLAEGSYDVRFTFAPVGADGSFDYALTITEDEVPTEINGATDFLFSLTYGELKSFTITATENAVWTFDLRAYASHCLVLLNSEGEQLTYDGWYNSPSISYELTAGESYTIQISRDSYDSEYVYANLTVTVEPVEVPEVTE